jgi:hypothetical protein
MDIEDEAATLVLVNEPDIVSPLVLAAGELRPIRERQFEGSLARVA